MMKRQRSRTLAIIGLLGSLMMPICSSPSLAQEQEQPKKKIAAPSGTLEKPVDDGLNFKFLEARYVMDKMVKGRPYSATAVTETIQTLGDGNQIRQKTEVTLYRDREGRTRREQTLETVGKWVAAGQPPQMISINDPVAGVNFALDPRSQTAEKWSTEATSAKLDLMKLVLMKKMNELAVVTEADKTKLKMKEAALDKAAPLANRGSGSKAEKKGEMLGQQLIEGVEAYGTRTTITIPAGQIGNTLPIEIVDEQWYSPELQTLVMTKHHDPRSGDTIYRLTNINRNDPNPSLFELPAGYTLKEESALPAKKKKIEEKLDKQ